VEQLLPIRQIRKIILVINSKILLIIEVTEEDVMEVVIEIIEVNNSNDQIEAITIGQIKAIQDVIILDLVVKEEVVDQEKMNQPKVVEEEIGTEVKENNLKIIPMVDVITTIVIKGLKNVVVIELRLTRNVNLHVTNNNISSSHSSSSNNNNRCNLLNNTMEVEVKTKEVKEPLVIVILVNGAIVRIMSPNAITTMKHCPL